MKKDSRDN